MPQNPLRLGLIGCGLATKNLHWPALRQLPDKFRIAAVCNRSPEKAREFAQMAGVDKIETDYRRLLDMPDLDAVLVCLPIDQNASVTRDCLATGKHVLCEKPLAHTLEEAKALRDFARQAPKVLLVGENYYYRDDFRDALALIRDGGIGEIFVLMYEALAQVDHTKSYGATTWRQIPAYRGGFVTDAGVHHAAVLRMFGNDIHAVQALAKNVHPVIRAEDNIAANIEFANGAIGHYFASYTAKAPQFGTRLRILGTEGSLEIMHGSLTFFNPKNSSAPEMRQYPNFDNGFRNEWQAFYDAVCHGKAFPSTADQCYLDQVVITAMLDSATRHEVMILKQLDGH